MILKKTRARLFTNVSIVLLAAVAGTTQGCGKKNQEAQSQGDSNQSQGDGKNKTDSDQPKSGLAGSDLVKAAESIEQSAAWATRKAGAVRLRRQSLEALERAKTDKDRRDEAARYASSFEFQNASFDEWKLIPLQDALYADAITELGFAWVRYIDKKMPDPTLDGSQIALIESWSDDGLRGSLLDIIFLSYETAHQVDYPRLAQESFKRERYWSKLLPMVQDLLLKRVWAEMNPPSVSYGCRMCRKNYRFSMDLRSIELSTLQDWTSRLSAVIQSHDWLLKHAQWAAPIGSQLMSQWNRLDFVEGSFNPPGSSAEAKRRMLTLQLLRDQIDVIAQGDSAHSVSFQ